MTDRDDHNAGEELRTTRMTFGEHLEELRSRLIKGILVSLVGLVVAFIYNVEMFRVVTHPYTEVMRDLGGRTALVATAVTQGFFSHVKVALIIGLMGTAPFWIYQLWAFIGAGLYRRERKHIYRYAPLCFLLFAAGVLFGYFLLIPLGLKWLLTFADPASIQNLITISEYLRFFTLLTLVLGVAFQLPVIMMGLVKFGMATTAQLRDKRKYAIVAIFVIAALLTPPDPVTQVLLALPLMALYQLGLAMSWVGMGSGRPPLDWPSLWRFWRKILILALLAFLFRQPIIGVWQRSQVEANLMSEERSGQPPVLRIGQELLGRPMQGAYRFLEERDRSRWVLSGDQRCWVLTLTRHRDDLVVSDRKAAINGAQLLVFEYYPQRKVVYEAELPLWVPYADFVPALLEAFRTGGQTAQAELGRMLSQLSGKHPQGDGETAWKVFSQWFEQHRNGALRQKEGR